MPSRVSPAGAPRLLPRLIIRLLLVGTLPLGFGLPGPGQAVRASETPRSDALQAIRQVWPEEHMDSAIRLAHLESGLMPTARGCGGDCFGLFQIHYAANRSLIAAMGIRSPEELLDPVVNSSVAYAIFRQSGWRPWGVQP
ncbi:hypothetical protein [Cyanobium sp. NIES-981]|uniref:hypothetical protein n=1 Tax=Cyanobium sp. NIES-981 TaxID=1851505 RepID=UPI0007DD62C1|nr:hypothetical protein [Cyanobium sp. NIES-981]SBO41855.1 conserved protein of unknown function [Cyanobium sp. NIES-981]